MIAKEKIIVLKSFKSGEADVIVHGLNPLGARMGFYARGGKKSRKRFAGGILEPTHYIEVTYKMNVAHETDPLHTLQEAHLLREFSRLRTDYRRLETALYLLKIVHRLSQQGVVDSPETFNLLGNGLAACENSADLERLKVHFELKILAAQGVLPMDESFQLLLRSPLAAHEQMVLSNERWRWVQHQAHEHLRHYLEMGLEAGGERG